MLKFILALLLCLPVAALDVVGGLTGFSVGVTLRNATTGQLETGVAFGDMTITYTFNDDTVENAVTEVTMTAGTWASGGWVAVGNGYQFGVPNVAIADGHHQVKFYFVSSGVITAEKTIDLTDVDTRNGPNIYSDIIMVSGDATSANNLELQYDTTGVSGDNFPATQNQVGNISSGSSAISTTAGSFTKSGAEPETNTYTATVQEDGTYHIVEDVAGATDAYYQFDVGGAGVPVSVTWTGYAQANGDSYTVHAYNYGTTSYEQLSTLTASNGTTPSTEQFSLTTSHVGSGANDGLVRFRFLSADGTAFATDRIFCSYSVVGTTGGYANGAIWVNTNASNVGTEIHVDGVVDNPVSTWAAALSLGSQLTMNKFAIVNGSAIVLTANSDNCTMIGAGYTIDLNGQSIESAYFEGAQITGTGLATVTPPTFHRCGFGAVTIPPSIMTLCGIGAGGATFTGGSVGDYYFADCVSMVAGAGAPPFDFSGLATTSTVNNRRWAGGATYTLAANVTLSHEVLAGGTTAVTTNGGDAEVRGVTRALTVVMSAAETVQFVGMTGPVTLSGTTTGAVNLYGVCSSLTNTTTAAAVSDQALSQTYVDTRTILAGAYFDPAADTVANVTTVGTTTNNTDMLTAAAVNAEVDTALGDYDGPTNAEMIARTIVTANYFDPAADTVANVAALAGHTAQTADHTANVAAVLLDTGTTLPAQITGLNNLSAAAVNAEVDTALADIHLDHLLAVNYDPASQPGVGTALLNELIESNAGVSRYTALALAEGPSSSGGDATETKQDDIVDKLKGLMSKDHTLATAVGTFTPATDANEAIRNVVDGITGASGDTAVTSDTGGVDVLAYKDSGGAGIGGATVSAYPTSEYIVGTFSLVTSATTDDDGAWGPIWLDAGIQYTLVYNRTGPDPYGPNTMTVTP